MQAQPQHFRHALFGAFALSLVACGGGSSSDGSGGNGGSGGGGGVASYTVTPSAGPNGSVDPGVPLTVQHGRTTTFTVTPDSGYSIDSVTGCGGSLSGDTYTTGAITGDCTVSASFSPDAPGAVSLEWTPASVKRFRFSWTDVAGATEYRLLENPDGSSGYTQVAAFAPGTGSHELEVFLPARINASYLLSACNAAGCADSEPVFVSGSLARAVGYVKASNTEERDSFGISVALSADGDTLAVGAYRESSSATGIDGDEADNASSLSGAVYIFSRESGAWLQQAYVKASNTGEGDWFGSAVALSANGNTLAVGAYGEDSSANGIDGDETDNSASNSGAVYVFSREDGAWSQQAYVKASNTGTSDNFGYAVALSGDGDTLAVGAHLERSSATGINGDESDDSAFWSGAVYVFSREGGAWSQQAYVKASNTGADDEFGIAVALSGDGDTLAVGAYMEDSNTAVINGDEADDSAIDSGAVYVLTREGGAWSQQAYVKASNTGAGDLFGSAVALSTDGATLAVGAWGEDSRATGIDGDEADDSATNSGAVYVFSREGSAWSRQAYVKASNTGFDNEFGTSLAFSADGATLAVGAWGEDGNATGINGDDSDNPATDSGAVYVLTRESGTWFQKARVKASNTDVFDYFGYAVALSGDGETLAVGSYWEDGKATGIDGDQADNSAANSGAVYLY